MSQPTPPTAGPDSRVNWDLLEWYGFKPRQKAPASELRREKLVRTVACPSCGRPPGRQCRSMIMSHTARYNAAAAAGLVPALRPIPAEECSCH
jgi:hypothetical protein